MKISPSTISLNFTKRLFFVILFMKAFSYIGLSQDHHVYTIRFEGKTPSEITLDVKKPSKDKESVVINLKKPELFPSGTTFYIPATCMLGFQDKNGYIQRVGPPDKGNMTMTYTATYTPSSESHRATGGKIYNSVHEGQVLPNGYNYRSGIGDGELALITNTAFTIKPGKNGNSVFITNKGTISIIEKVEVEIKDKRSFIPKKRFNKAFKKYKPDLTTTKKTSLSSNDGEYVSGKTEKIGYNNFDEAVVKIKSKIINDNDSAHDDELVEDYVLLGELYLHHNNTDSAIHYLRKAVKLNEKLDPNALTTLESRLYLAEALIYHPKKATEDFNSPKNKEARIILTQEMIDLDKELAYDKKHFKIATESNDSHLIDYYCHNLFKTYHFLSWANNLYAQMYKTSDKNKSKTYSGKAKKYDGLSTNYKCKH